MSLIAEITGQNDGAIFYRADLHIHSYGNVGSYDVKDNQMTPENIIEIAIKENLRVISITDHNEIGNVPAAVEYSKDKPIYIVPGVELSTTQGHLLVYFPSFDSLKSFYGQLTISQDKKTCNHTIPQCLDLAAKYDGFGVAAHIDIESGFEGYVKGYTPFKEELFCHPNLLGLELSSAQNENWFTDRDTVNERKHFINQRRKKLGEDQTYDLAKVMSSDSHSVIALGKNAVGNRKLTRIKMSEFNFNSFRIAFIDASARLRIEDLIPNSFPHFVGVKFDGGFLDGQVVRFSKNLTSVIGGRGTGKSTIMEAIRSSSGNEAREGLVDNEIWPDRISLVYEDEAGMQQIFTKDKLKELVNSTDPANGILNIRIESFGQGETAETIQHCGKNPGVLLKFFDDFVEFGTLKSDDEEICQKLLDNQTLIERLTLEVSTMPQIEKAKLNADAQVKALKAKDAKTVVELEESLANERSLRDELINNLKTLIKGIKDSLSDKSLFELVLGFKDDQIIIGKTEFIAVKLLIEAYSKNIDGYSSKLDSESMEVANKIKAQLDQWKEKDKTTLTKIEGIRKELEAKGIKLDIGFIRKITKDASDYAVRITELNLKKKELEKTILERKTHLDQRKEIKQNIFKKRYEFVYKLNENLKATVVDYNIDIKLHEGLYSPALHQIIKDSTGWRTQQVPKADLIVRQVPYFVLLEAIRKNDSTCLLSVKYSDNSSVFGKQDADNVIQILKQPTTFYNIERCAFDDIPEIIIAKKIIVAGKEVYQKRDFSKLSLGQQQSILLSILLFSNRNCPLLIDQPEDNLDSEFIYKTLVKNLRRIKEFRQVIIVTHNANIAVLGDAELIVPLRSSSDKSIIVDRGSIDNDKTKKITCTILEGGEKAFHKRKEIYGF